jgi:50S ribosomal subunit-associated GTPase HflX
MTTNTITIKAGVNTAQQASEAIEKLQQELHSWQYSHKLVMKDLAEYRKEDFPGRVKTNGILEKEDYERKCRLRIDGIQRQLKHLHTLKNQKS